MGPVLEHCSNTGTLFQYRNIVPIQASYGHAGRLFVYIAEYSVNLYLNVLLATDPGKCVSDMRF